MVDKKTKDARKKGFTLIELLIVIGVLGILAGIILVAVDPAKRLRQARDARRHAEVNAILNAILNYTVDNVGTAPTGIDSNATSIQQLGDGTGVCGVDWGCQQGTNSTWTLDDCVDFTSDLVDEYIAEIPVDPEGSNGTVTYSASRTGYYINRTGNGRIEIGSCNPEDVSEITVKR